MSTRTPFRRRLVLARRLNGRATHDGGFSIVEVLFAMLILSVVATASSGFFVSALGTSNGQTQRQSAVGLAQQQLDAVRAVNLTTTSLVAGRKASEVCNLDAFLGLTTTATNIQLYDADTTLVSPCTAGTTTPALSSYTSDASDAVKMLFTTTLQNVTYTVRTALDKCMLSVGSGVCSPITSSATGAIVKIIVDVSWPKSVANGCTTNSAGSCDYQLFGYRDTTADPTFASSTPTLTTAGPSPLHWKEWTNLVVGGQNLLSPPASTTTPTLTVTGTSGKFAPQPTWTLGTVMTSPSTVSGTTQAVSVNPYVANAPTTNGSTPDYSQLPSITVNATNTTAAGTYSASSPISLSFAESNPVISNVTGTTTAAQYSVSVPFTVTGSDFYNTGPSSYPTVTATFVPNGGTATTTTALVTVTSATSSSIAFQIASWPPRTTNCTNWNQVFVGILGFGYWQNTTCNTYAPQNYTLNVTVKNADAGAKNSVGGGTGQSTVYSLPVTAT